MIRTVKHGGSLGDLVYGLWALKALGGCEKFLVSSKNMTLRAYRLILPLLEVQSYIGSVRFIPEYKDYWAQGINIDMDVFRADLARPAPKHIGQAYVNMLNRIYNLDLPDFDGEPWLEGVRKPKAKNSYVSVNRSHRYRNHAFDYRRYIGKNPAKFLGVRSEFDDFKNTFPELTLTYTRVNNLLEAAAVISGSKYFVGNQSVGSALAQGMGHPQIQEFFPTMPDCPPKITLEGQPFIKNWSITEDDYHVSGEMVFPEFRIPPCRVQSKSSTGR